MNRVSHQTQNCNDKFCFFGMLNQHSNKSKTCQKHPKKPSKTPKKQSKDTRGIQQHVKNTFKTHDEKHQKNTMKNTHYTHGACISICHCPLNYVSLQSYYII